MYELKTVSKTLKDKSGELEFSTTQFPCMKALEIMVSLQKLGSSGAPGNAHISAAMAGLKPEEAGKLFVDVLQCTTTIIETPQGKRQITFNSKDALDKVFSGRLKLLFDVLEHAIEVNYGDFTEGSDVPAPPAQTPDL
jgi:hypothetical protein